MTNHIVNTGDLLREAASWLEDSGTDEDSVVKAIEHALMIVKERAHQKFKQKYGVMSPYGFHKDRPKEETIQAIRDAAR